MTGASLRNVLGHAKRLRIALRAAEPLCVLRNVPERSPPSRPRIPYVYGLEVGSRRRTWLMGIRVPFAVSRFARKARYFGVGGGRGCRGDLSQAYFWNVSPTINYPWHTCAKACWCYTCNCCFRAGWNSPLAVNRAVPNGRRGAGKVPATEPMSPRPVCALVRMPAELVRSQYQRLESG